MITNELSSKLQNAKKIAFSNHKTSDLFYLIYCGYKKQHHLLFNNIVQWSYRKNKRIKFNLLTTLIKFCFLPKYYIKEYKKINIDSK